jgi:ACDE family multidrug resistance protein
MSLLPTSFKDRPELERTASFLYGVSALSMMGVTFISPVFPLMFLEIGMTEMDMANMIAWFTFPALIFIPLWGFIADRFQRKIVLAVSLLLFGVCGTAIFFTDNMQTILLLRFAQGIGVSGIMPMSGTIIGDMFSKQTDLEVGAQGLRVVSINIAKFFYPVAGGLLGGIAWNLPFLFFFIAIPAGLYTLKYMPEMGTEEKEPRTTSCVYF